MAEEGAALLDFVVGGCQVNVLSIDLSLEVSMLSIELLNSLFEVSLVFSFLGGSFVEAVNNFSSEFVEGINDLFNDVLVREVLVEGELK